MFANSMSDMIGEQHTKEWKMGRKIVEIKSLEK